MGGEIDLFKEMLKQTPYAAAGIFLFLRVLQWIKEYQVMETARTERVAGALEKNNELLGRVSENLNRSAQALESLKRGDK